MITTDLVVEKNIVYRIQKSEVSDSKRVILLLHGWGGDETSMWVFRDMLPTDAWILAPRGLYATGDKGFTWIETTDRLIPGLEGLEAYRACSMHIDKVVGDVTARFGIREMVIDIVGFSQGGATTCAYKFFSQRSIDRIACLAGFLPRGVAKHDWVGKFSGSRVFIAHGLRDEIVPIANSQEFVEYMEDEGISVNKCIDESDHRIGIGCMKALGDFLK